MRVIVHQSGKTFDLSRAIKDVHDFSGFVVSRIAGCEIIEGVGSDAGTWALKYRGSVIGKFKSRYEAEEHAEIEFDNARDAIAEGHAGSEAYLEEMIKRVMPNVRYALERGNSLEEAIAYAKERSTAGPKVWEIVRQRARS